MSRAMMIIDETKKTTISNESSYRNLNICKRPIRTLQMPQGSWLGIVRTARILHYLLGRRDFPSLQANGCVPIYLYCELENIDQASSSLPACPFSIPELRDFQYFQEQF